MEGRPELAELLGVLHYRFSYGQNALLHCEETGYLCGLLAAELGLPQPAAREAGALHDIGKAVDHDVEGSHAIIGGELLRILGTDPTVVHAVKAHHFDEEPTTDLAMLTICADAISASRPGARRDTLTAYLARLEQLQRSPPAMPRWSAPTPSRRVARCASSSVPASGGRRRCPALTGEIAREIEAEMQYPGVIKVMVIRETSGDGDRPGPGRPVGRGRRARAVGRTIQAAPASAEARPRRIRLRAADGEPAGARSAPTTVVPRSRGSLPVSGQEGDDDLGGEIGVLVEEEVAAALEPVPARAGDELRERLGVGERDQDVLGAVEHQRRRRDLAETSTESASREARNWAVKARAAIGWPPDRRPPCR